jgi:hypothetical protein
MELQEPLELPDPPVHQETVSLGLVVGMEVQLVIYLTVLMTLSHIQPTIQQFIFIPEQLLLQ